MSKPTVLYNGSCPVCRAEIEHYRKLDGDGGALAWRDVSAADGAATPCGLDPEALRRRLHVAAPDGRLLVGVPAFASIWERLPRYRWLAWLVRLPLMERLAGVAYEPLAALLYAFDRRRRRRALTTVDQPR